MSATIAFSLVPDEAPDGASDLQPAVAGTPTSGEAGVTDGQLTFDLASDARPPRSLRRPDRIDDAFREMREFLSFALPATDAEALQSLRQAFPTVPLSDRIAVIQTRFFA
jgi:hypothetical protein